MSVRSKVAGAAVKVAAPEAALAAKAAPGSAADHRAKIDAIKARRPPEPEPDQHEDQADDEHEHAGGLDPVSPGHAGGGFVLGVIVWAVVRAYIGNPGQPSGAAGVKRLALAKLFNKTN